MLTMANIKYIKDLSDKKGLSLREIVSIYCREKKNRLIL